MRHRLVHLAALISLLVISMVLALAAVEMGLRLLYPMGGAPEIFEFDPVLGHRMRPNVDLMQVWDNHENVGRIRTNDMGLRTATTSPDKAAGEYRILLLGDSYTFGYGVGDEDTFARRLEGRLRARGDRTRRFSVVNAGVSSYGTAHALLQYERLAPSVHPDLVILNVFVGNDLQDNLCLSLRALRPTKTFPCFGLRDGELVQVSVPERPEPARGGLVQRLLAPLRQLQLVTLAQQRATPLFMENPSVLRFLSSLGIDVDPGYLPHVVAAWYVSPVAEDGWALTRALLARLQTEVEADGARFFVTLIPSRAQVLPAFASVLPILYPDSAPVEAFVRDPMKPQRLLRRFLEERGVPTLDFMPSILAQPDPNALYYPVIAHWSEEGNALAAASLEDMLEREGVFP